MNKAIIIGRLTRDPEMINHTRSDGSSQAITNFDIAVNRQGSDTADFFRCTSFGKQAEFVKRYFKKGKRVAVEGRLRNNNYTSADGTKVYAVGLITDSVEFADGKRDNEEHPASGPDAADEFVAVPKDVDMPFEG